MTPEKLARTTKKVDALTAALAGRSAPVKRTAAARAVARTLQETDFPSGACQVIWRELQASRLNPHSTTYVDRDELRHLAGRVEDMRRLLAMYPR
jgi:hypothetical protein